LFIFNAFVNEYALEEPLVKKVFALFVLTVPNNPLPKLTPVVPVVILALENTGVLKNF
jgi:hypothetical protein